MAAARTARVAAASLVGYCVLSYCLLTRRDGLDGLESCYFISATLSTVGFGDFAPAAQDTRLAA